MTGLTWAILLLVCGLLLIVLEVFVPSGGVIGFLSIAALLTARVSVPVLQLKQFQRELLLLLLFDF